ncbi:MAG: MFS transporter [Solirubrobacteraceae bacterium]|nr:MFS transporter [Solirubrobacteraceae bacterium]
MPARTAHAARDGRPGAIVAALAAGAFAYSVLQTIVAPALPELAQRLGTTTSDASWILTALLLSASVLTPLIGRLGDLYGQRRLLVAALAVMTVGTLVSALATSLGVMIAGRVLQGAGAGLFPLAYGLIRRELPPHRVPHAIGLLSAMLGIGGVAGIVGAGVILAALSFHWLFWAPLAASVAATFAVWRWVPEPAERRVAPRGRVNWAGAALLAAGLVITLLGITQARTWGWGSALNVGCIAGGVLVLMLWVALERRSRDPLVDMKVMAERGVWTTNVVTFVVGFGMLAGMVVVPALLQMPAATGYGFGFDVLHAGLCMLPSGLGMLVGGAVAAPLQERSSARTVTLAGVTMIGVSYAMLAVAHGSAGDVLGAASVQGLGIGLAFAALGRMIVEAAPHAQVGAATGINTIMRTVGGAFGSSVSISLLAAHLVPGTPLPENGGFSLVFWVAAGVCLAGLLIGLLLPRERPVVVVAAVEDPAGRGIRLGQAA